MREGGKEGGREGWRGEGGREIGREGGWRGEQMAILQSKQVVKSTSVNELSNLQVWDMG